MSKTSGRPSPIDRIYQIGYMCAYRAVRFYWWLTRPHCHGALVAAWHDDTILLVRNSYLPYYNLPGGYIRRGETPRQAAQRELLEEVGMSIPADAMTLAVDITHDWEYKRDHVKIYQIDLDQPPALQVDHREVITARLYTPQEALELELFPPLRSHIEQHLASHPSKSCGDGTYQTAPASSSRRVLHRE